MALLVVQAAFAAGAVEGKIALSPPAAGGEGVSPWALAMARMVGAALFFHALGPFLRKGATERVRLGVGDHARLAGLAMLGIAVNQALFLLGLRITTAFVAALLAGTIPVFTAVVTVAMGRESPSLRLWAGVAASFAGVAWLVGVRSVDVGAMVIAANCLSYSLYLVLSGPTIQRLGAIRMITWVFTWGAVLFAPIGVPALIADAPTWTPRGMSLVAFFVLVPSIVAYSANAWALGRTTATVVAIYVNLQPLLAALLQWVQLGQRVTGRMVVASGMIFAGLWLVATRRK